VAVASSILSPVHLAVVLVVVLMLFGTKRLPDLGKSLGSSMRAFRDSVDGGADSRLTESGLLGQATTEPATELEQRPKAAA